MKNDEALLAPIDGRPYWLLRRPDGGPCEPGAIDLRTEFRLTVDMPNSVRFPPLEERWRPPERGGAIDTLVPVAIDARGLLPSAAPELGRFAAEAS